MFNVEAFQGAVISRGKNDIPTAVQYPSFLSAVSLAVSLFMFLYAAVLIM